MANRIELNCLRKKIIGAAIEVHRRLGPGLFESVYEECLCYELELQKISFERQKYVPITYKGQTLNLGFRADLIVAQEVVVELKSVDTLMPVHKSQILTYLKFSGLSLGLIINFNVPILK